MQCNPEELQYFLDYKTDLPSPQPLPSNSSTIRAGECIIHPVVSPVIVGLPVIKHTRLPERSHFQEIQLKILSYPL